MAVGEHRDRNVKPATEEVRRSNASGCSSLERVSMCSALSGSGEAASKERMPVCTAGGRAAVRRATFSAAREGLRNRTVSNRRVMRR